MHPLIQVRVEGKRGCGYRKEGGLYLCCDGPCAPCGRLPIPLDVCPTCGHGVKPTRGWTWVNGTAILDQAGECKGGACRSCPLSRPAGRVGLLWVGEQFYATPAEWTAEAVRMGVSRRVGAVPRDFKLFETWVWVAHRKAILNPDGSHTAGVFHAFLPTLVEVIVTGSEPDEEIEDLIKRGLTPVKVLRDTEHKPLFDPTV